MELKSNTFIHFRSLYYPSVQRVSFLWILLEVMTYGFYSPVRWLNDLGSILVESVGRESSRESLYTSQLFYNSDLSKPFTRTQKKKNSSPTNDWVGRSVCRFWVEQDKGNSRLKISGDQSYVKRSLLKFLEDLSVVSRTLLHQWNLIVGLNFIDLD